MDIEGPLAERLRDAMASGRTGRVGYQEPQGKAANQVYRGQLKSHAEGLVWRGQRGSSAVHKGGGDERGRGGKVDVGGEDSALTNKRVDNRSESRSYQVMR